MKESISIKNFGPLRDINIDEIKPMTVDRIRRCVRYKWK